MVDVSIIMMCFNQECTIARAIESVLNQQTDFTYEIIIGDDHSTDNTRSICIEYSKKHHNIIVNDDHPNYGVVKNYAFCLSRCSGEFLMGCSCDDWWHNPQKIQTQISYMKSHPKCVLFYSGYRIFYPEVNKYEFIEPAKIKLPQFESVLKRNPVCALTACVRMSAMRKIDFDSFAKQGFLVEDYPKWMALSLLGDFYCSDDVFVTYSSYVGSVQHSNTYLKRIKYVDNDYKMRLYFANQAGKLDELEQMLEDLYFREKAEVAVQYGERKDARIYFSRIKKKDYKIHLKYLLCCSPISFVFYCNRYNKKLRFR